MAMAIVFAKGRANIIRSAGSGASAGLGRLHLIVFYRFRHEQPSASAPAARRAPAAGAHEKREDPIERINRGRPMKCGAFDQLRPGRRVVENVRGQQVNSLRVTAGFIRRDSMMQPCHAGALLQIEPKQSIENFCSHSFSPGAAESDVKEGSSTGKTLPARIGAGGKKVPRFSCPNEVASRIRPAIGSGRFRKAASVQRRSADIPVCGFWGLSSPQFVSDANIAELESSVNPQAGKPAPPSAAALNR
jgi:hypothetical protein